MRCRRPSQPKRRLRSTREAFNYNHLIVYGIRHKNNLNVTLQFIAPSVILGGKVTRQFTYLFGSIPIVGSAVYLYFC